MRRKLYGLNSGLAIASGLAAQSMATENIGPPAPVSSIPSSRQIQWHELEFTFNVVQLREYLPLGQRVDAFAVDAWQGEEWREFAHGTSIGNQRLLRTASPILTQKVLLRITQAAACPALAEFGLFMRPELPPPQAFAR